MDNIKERFDAVKEEAASRRAKFENTAGPTVYIGMATCGIASGALETKKAFEEAIEERGLTVKIKTLGCIGHCYAEPVVVIDHPESGFPPILYPEINPGKAKMLTKLYLEEWDPRLEHMLGATVENELIPSVMEFSRFSREKRVVMEKCGHIDPEDIYDYVASGGYEALVKALTLSPEGIIGMVKESGLRGRGGAGFPTGLKWEFGAKSPGDHKIVICNGDEGDPGAYMDRTIIESNPHQLIEGMAICALAVGAQRAIVYVRSEYPLAVELITKAVAKAKELGLLGDNILGSSFSLKVDIFQGSGAFVCGEETALIRSVEGYRGAPVRRPPFPVEKGLYGLPTVINNVKTLAAIPPIVNDGPEKYRSIGTENSPGTAIFSVVGDVVHPGLVEIPMGVTLRTLIFDICGGIPKQKKFKAVQIGGPSGGCLPEEFLDTPVDFDSLAQAGAMMGSGGMVVMDEDTCMVDVARYFLDFTQKESCGKCTFCRIGTHQILDILTRLTKGEGREGDLERLESLSKDVKGGSLCGLGKTAPNPVLTSLKYFRDEYEAHLYDKKCPGFSCRELIAFYIDPDACAKGCDICGSCCPVDAVFSLKNRKKGIDMGLCVKCGECMVACPPDYDAVRKISPPEDAPVLEKPESGK